MAEFSTTRRTLLMHPAHRTVGVSGDRAVAGPYCRVESFAAHAAPIQAALVANRRDRDAWAVLVLFEQAMDWRSDVECRRVDFEDCPDFRVSENGTAPFDFDAADCVVVFGRWLQIVRHWRDIDVAALAAGPRCADGEAMEVEIAAPGRHHPVLDGLDPFLLSTKGTKSQGVVIPQGATLLLTCKMAGEDCPVAWLERRGEGEAFHTVLGSPADFRQPDFVRLMLGVVAWIRR